MSALSQFFAGGGGIQTDYPFAVSGTWVAPLSGVARFTAIGGGGSGGSGRGNAVGRRAGGGGAGGLAQKTIRVQAGDTFTITVGAGGASVASAFNAEAAGNTGGTTSANGPGLSLLATGGSGGNAGLITSTLAAAAGGVGSGGDFNTTGGSGGGFSAAGAGTFLQAAAGGAVGLFGDGASGTVSTTTSGSHIALGGTGIGGGSTNTGTAPGGAGGPASGATTPGLDLFQGIADSLNQAVKILFDAAGAGSTANAGAQNGAGTPGRVLTGGVGDIRAGALAGGGGTCNTDGTANNTISSSGGIGGGGGGCLSLNAGQANSGAGGSGFVFIEFVGAP